MAEQYFGITDTGTRRSNNEDCFIAQYLGSRRYILAAVIDGLGGYDGGEVAAQIASDAVISGLENFDGDPIHALVDALRVANNNISNARRSNKQLFQMACVATIAIADVERNKFFYAHVGDTRLYLLRDRSLVKITKDQSFVGFLEDNGKLSEEDAMRHPKRNEINKALGFDAPADFENYVETGESPFLPGDMLLLCSDGLSDMIHSNEMTGILTTDGDLESKGKQLVDAANKAGGEDNITVVLVLNDRTPVQQVANKPVKKQEPVVYPPIAEDEADEFVPKNKQSANKSFWWVIITLLFILLAFLGWKLYENYGNSSFEAKSTEVLPMEAPPNAIEQLLADTINHKRMLIVELSKKRTGDVVFTRPVKINIDSVRILGDGVSLVSDTAFHGSAFELGTNCKYFLLDNLVLENFETGVLVKKKGLHLKNVRFINCNVPVQYNFMFPPARFITGNIADSIFRKDSIPQ